MEFLKLQEQERAEVYRQVGKKINLNEVAVEKDWWVTAVLRALFALPYAENLSFKGGTSLSKCYNLIERFSEDVDIAINREFMTPKKYLWNTSRFSTQVRTLRIRLFWKSEVVQ